MTLPPGFEQVLPRKGFGPIRFGMSKAECRSFLGNPQRSEALLEDYGALRLIFGRDGRLRRGRFHGSLGADPVIGDLKVLSTPASQAIEALTSVAGPPRVSHQHFAFPLLGLALWREGSDIPHFRMLEVESTDPALNQPEGKLTAEGVARLVADPLVSKLRLDRTDIDDQALAGLAGCRHLKILSLKETGITDEGLRHVGECTGLTSVYLDETRVTDLGLSFLAALPRLDHLAVNDTAIRGSGFLALAGCPLTILAASYTHITSEEGAALGTLKPLQRLSLNHVFGIDDRLIPVLIQLRELTFLEVIDCPGLSAEGLRGLRESLPNCRVHH